MNSFNDDMKKERDAYSEWVLSLKVGDEFVLPGRGFYAHPAIYVVERLTATQIIARYDTRISRVTGRVIGSKNYSNIQRVTQEISDKIEQHKLTTWLCALKPQKLQVLRAMKAAYDAVISETVSNEVEK